MVKKTILEQVLPTTYASMPIRRARESFWHYCMLRNPQFFRESRPHLKELCVTLQAVYEGKLKAPDGTPCRRLAISEPPRHGKSYTLSLFEEWILGKKQTNKIISVSYNEILSSRFSKGVRDGISATKIDPSVRIFSDVFPGVRIKDGDAAAQIWSLEGQYFNFLGAGMGGTITGVGCNLLMIDDPIKNHIEANNDRILDEQWEYFVNTLLSRLEENGIIILVMTRWNTRDLVGRVLEEEPGKWHVLRHAACLDEVEGRMLCPSLLSFESYMAKKRLTSPEIMEANFQNNPVDVQGRLYQSFSTYDPAAYDRTKATRRLAYVDTADTGADYLCAITADEVEGEGVLTGVVYTDAPMEETEEQVADLLYMTNTREAYIESNNGGRGFARNVERILWTKYQWKGCTIIPVPQRQNKMARILTEAGFVQQHLYLPEEWRQKQPLFWLALQNFQRKGRNAHDDAPDTMTGLAEMIQRGGIIRKKFFSGRGRRA